MAEPISQLIIAKCPKMFVFDMAGTIINENGIVYKTLYDSIQIYNPWREIYNDERKKWPGLSKKEVLKRHVKSSDIEKVYEDFQTLLKYRYNQSPIKLVDNGIYDLFIKLRKHGFKVALNTGYSSEIQNDLIKRFSLFDYIDDYISSDKVKSGRPYPYMIQELMKRNNIVGSSNVIKVGDTINDIKEAKEAQCGISIGVLSGEGTRLEFEYVKANYIFNNIMDLEEYFKIM